MAAAPNKGTSVRAKPQKRVPVANEKARNRAVVITLTVAAVLLTALTVLLLCFPRIQAGIQFRRAFGSLQDAKPEEISAVQIINLHIIDTDVDFRPLTASVYLNADDHPEAIREALLGLADRMRYDERKSLPVGGFDLEVRYTLTDGSHLDFYLLDDRLYLRVGQTNFYFKPKGDAAEDYADLRASVQTLLDAKRGSGER